LGDKKQWLKKSPEEEQMVALSAQLQEAETKIAGLSKAAAKLETVKDEESDDKVKERSKRWKQKAPWRYENPDGLTHLKRGGKNWIWCSYHKYWGKHKEVNCEEKKRLKESKKEDNETPTPKKGKRDKSNALSIARALIAITAGDDSEVEISDDDES
jgi:alpha-galactosidase/6-phospho-beta-glucosidase family protein